MAFPALTIGDLTARMPVVQGGMGVGVSLSRLASAVANEGGIGVIAAAMIGMGEPDVVSDPVGANVRALRRELARARAATSGILGVNIMVALTTFGDMVKAAIESGADIIFSGAGLPMDLPKLYQEVCDKAKTHYRTKLVPIVSSGRAALLIAKKWMSRTGILPDAFVLEGPRAGGHLGFSEDHIFDKNCALDTLLSEVTSAAKSLEDKAGRAVPVIAGGGVWNGGDIARLLSLGASGVQMATRFVATNECDADIRFKQAYVDAKEEDVTIIHSPVGMPGRALDNAFLEAARQGQKKPFKCVFHCIKTCNPASTPYCISSALINAVRGNLDKGFVFCGANVGRVKSIISVHELMETLRREYSAFMNRLATA